MKKNGAFDVLPFRFVPPVGLSNCFVCGRISSNGAHDSETILINDLLHQLNSFQVSEHVTRKSLKCENFGREAKISPNRAYSV